MGEHGPLAGGDFQPKYPNFKPASEQVIQEFIVICPQLKYPGARANPWCKKENQQAVVKIIEKIHQEYKGDPNSTFLTGFSYGADGVCAIAQKSCGRRFG